MTLSARSGVLLACLTAAALALPSPGECAQRPTTAAVPAEIGQAGSAPTASTDLDAGQTRDRLMAILDKYPPSLGRVLKLDPTLMTNPGYLASYPQLASFLTQHPEVPRNPNFFLDRVSLSGSNYYVDQRTQDRREFYNLLGGFTAFLVFLTVTGVVVWLIRTVVDGRRWNKLSKVQFDVHTKLLDRFQKNEELIAYMQTPSGRRFLDSAPIPLHDDSRAIGAPFERILWSLQAGVVASVAGLGLLFVSWRLTDEVSQFFFVVGTVTLALGGGFIVSAGAAYVLSRRLGLFDRQNPEHA
jgi:hypothetical protein